MYEISEEQGSSLQESHTSLHSSYSFMGENRHASNLGGSQENWGDILQGSEGLHQQTRASSNLSNC